MTATAQARPRVALVGNASAHHPALPRIDLIAPHLPVQVEHVASEDVSGPDDLAGYDGIWVPPGSPYASMEGVLTAIRLARESEIPYLGTCGGFQHALIEYMRDVLGIADAAHLQYGDEDASTPAITPLVCSLKGEEESLHIGAGSRLSAIYGGAEQTTEIYQCRYGLNSDYIETIEHSDLAISGWDNEKTVRAVELPHHPFFIGTLFQPELASEPGSIHPLIHAYTEAVLQRAGARPGGSTA